MAGGVEPNMGLCVRCGRIMAPRGGRPPRFCAVCGLALPQGPVIEARLRRLRGAPPAATASLLLGLCSLLPVVGLPLGALAIVLGWRANTQILNSGGLQAGRSMAAAGTLLGVFGVIISLGICLGIR